MLEGMGREYLAPIVQLAMDYWRDSNDLLASESRERVSGIVHISAYIPLHLSASTATKILESLLDVLMSAPYMIATHSIMQLGQELVYFLRV